MAKFSADFWKSISEKFNKSDTLKTPPTSPGRHNADTALISASIALALGFAGCGNVIVDTDSETKPDTTSTTTITGCTVIPLDTEQHCQQYNGFGVSDGEACLQFTGDATLEGCVNAPLWGKSTTPLFNFTINGPNVSEHDKQSPSVSGEKVVCAQYDIGYLAQKNNDGKTFAVQFFLGVADNLCSGADNGNACIFYAPDTQLTVQCLP